ncbi:MAG: agmatinase [Planctomycetota bacterium]|nr:MAG: agmatinase [Planctomycetota bacterium]
MQQIRNFLDIPDATDAKVVVLPVAYDATATYLKGTAEGPGAVIDASAHVEYFDAELGLEPCNVVGIETHPVIKSSDSPEKFLPELTEIYSRIVAGGRFVLMLGGEHSITLAPVEALAEKREPFSILSLDAHSDLREEYEGTRYGHGSVMRRSREHVARIVEVGVRALDVEEARLVESDPGITVFFAHERRDADSIAEDVLEALTDRVYVSIDLDYFDMGIALSVGTPEPGGGSWWDALRILRRVFENKRVIGCDIVETRPAPGMVAAEFTAARLAYKLIGYRFCIGESVRHGGKKKKIAKG